MPAIITGSGTTLQLNENRFGSQEVQITAVNLLDTNRKMIAELPAGQPLSVEITYNAPHSVARPIVGVSISREDGFVVVDTSTEAAEVVLPELFGSGRICLHLARLDLLPGRYFVDVGIYEAQWAYAYDYHWHSYPLLLSGGQGKKGILSPPHHWDLGIQE